MIRKNILSSLMLLAISNLGFSQTETISNIEVTDNLTLYPYGDGYVAGHNQFGDLAKADYFNYQGTYTHIHGVQINFGYALASNTTNTFNINIWDGTGGTPGAILETKTLSYYDLVNAGTPMIHYIDFSSTVLPDSKEFFVGIEFAYAGSGSGSVSEDIVALVTNTDPESSPATAWEVWNDRTWHPYDSSSTWGLQISHSIEPVLGNCVDVSTTLDDTTITSNAVGAVYQWLDCNNGMSIIPGESNNSFTVTTNGSYAVQVTKNGCSDISDCVNLTTLSIVNNSFSDNIIIYPNPTNENFIIGFKSNQEKLTIKLYTSLGQLIQTRIFENSDLIQMKINQPSGIYFVEIKNHNGDKSVKQFINKR